MDGGSVRLDANYIGLPGAERGVSGSIKKIPESAIWYGFVDVWMCVCQCSFNFAAFQPSSSLSDMGVGNRPLFRGRGVQGFRGEVPVPVPEPEPERA